MLKLLNVILVLFIILARTADARIAKESDLTHVHLKYHYKVQVTAKKSILSQVHREIKILSEAGRESQMVQTISYNPKMAKIKIVEAYTLNGKKKTPVEKRNIEIKEIGEARSFDPNKQMILAFPSVEVGSVLVLKYNEDNFHRELEGEYSDYVSAWDDIDDLSFEAESEVPLYTFEHDSEKLFRVVSEKKNKKYIVKIQTNRPIRSTLINEEHLYVDPTRKPAIFVSSRSQESGWKSYPQPITKEQEKLIAKALLKPDPLIKSIAAGVQDFAPGERESRMAAMVSQSLRYFGDWRHRNGGHVPRGIDEIIKTGYGDCKDMALTTVVVSRYLGLKADLAWVLRGDAAPADFNYKIPHEFGFNHAVARIEDGGHVYWVDPTNPVALPDGMVHADIADRLALVLKSDGAFLDRTPAITPDQISIKNEFDVTIEPNLQAHLNGRLTLAPHIAENTEQSLLNYSRDQAEYSLARWIAREEDIDNYKIEMPEKGDRVARTLQIFAHVTLSDVGLRTSAGFGFPLFRSGAVELLTTQTRDRYSDFFLGTPETVYENYNILGARLVGSQPLDCDIKSKWVEFERTVHAEKSVEHDLLSRDGGKVKTDRIAVKTTTRILKPVILNDEMMLDEFKVFQERVTNCLNRAAIIISPSPVSKSN